MPSSSCRISACAVFIVFVLLLAGSGIAYIMAYSTGGAAPEERYYRAVYVLQSLGGPAAAEKEAIPPRVIYTDATESLLHHPDKILVLRHVADQLSAAEQDHPKAALFEAYARLALGERERASALLMRYVVESEYDAGHYAMLCESLRGLGDMTSLLLIGREWEEREEGCRKDRAQYLWVALYNLGRYADAEAFAAGRAACLGWQAGVFAAKAALAQGKHETAEEHLEKTRRAYPEQALSISRAWNQLKSRESL